eukprot:TRINITY_DN274_c0_g2_i4.p1 TRINITY_DN274_c0_g2~~TRINITY_DN274_c0_g2_i4.p1  ORF type:complete len:274 (-),score=27.25 TRINITY_DN274_c0_g2_i4:1114-1935(-)
MVIVFLLCLWDVVVSYNSPMTLYLKTLPINVLVGEKRAYSSPLSFSNFLFSTEVFLGTPPKKLVLLVDTGSTDFLVQTPVCCNSEEYSPSGSLTVRPVYCGEPNISCRICQGNRTASQCRFNATYDDPISYWCAGSIWEDFFTFSMALPSVKIFFGATESCIENGVEGFSGLLGFGSFRISTWNVSSVVSKWMTFANLTPSVGFCLRSISSGVDGIITLGEQRREGFLWLPSAQEFRYWSGMLSLLRFTNVFLTKVPKNRLRWFNSNLLNNCE